MPQAAQTGWTVKPLTCVLTLEGGQGGRTRPGAGEKAKGPSRWGRVEERSQVRGQVPKTDQEDVVKPRGSVRPSPAQLLAHTPGPGSCDKSPRDRPVCGVPR